MAKNGTRCRPLYEDQDARISILANNLVLEGRIRFRRLLRASDTNRLPTGRAIRLTRRLNAVRCLEVGRADHNRFRCGFRCRKPLHHAQKTPLSPHRFQRL